MEKAQLPRVLKDMDNFYSHRVRQVLDNLAGCLRNYINYIN